MDAIDTLVWLNDASNAPVQTSCGVCILSRQSQSHYVDFCQRKRKIHGDTAWRNPGRPLSWPKTTTKEDCEKGHTLETPWGNPMQSTSSSQQESNQGQSSTSCCWKPSMREEAATGVHSRLTLGEMGIEKHSVTKKET